MSLFMMEGEKFMNLWNKKYKELGFNSQRLYSNEELLRFFGKIFFKIPKSERKDIKI